MMRTLLSLILLVGGEAFTKMRAGAADLGLEVKRAVEVSFQTEQGKFYQLESSPSLDVPTWTRYGAVIAGSGSRYDAGFLTGDTITGFFVSKKLEQQMASSHITASTEMRMMEVVILGYPEVLSTSVL